MFSKLKQKFNDYVINRHRQAIYDAVEECQKYTFVWCVNSDKYAFNGTDTNLVEFAKKQAIAAIASHIVGQYFWWTSIDRKAVYRYTKYVIKNAIGVHYHGCDMFGNCAAYHFTLEPGYSEHAPSMLMIDHADLVVLKKKLVNRLITEFIQSLSKKNRGGHLQQVRYSNPETKNIYSFWFMRPIGSHRLVKK